MSRRAVWLLMLCLGCDQAALPSELDHRRVIAVRADPPALAAGQSATFEILVTGDAGVPWVESGTTARVVLPAGLPEPVAERARSLLDRDGDVWRLSAPEPDELAAFAAAVGVEPADVAIEVELTVTVDGDELVARKIVGLGGSGTNPTIGELTVGGVAAEDDPIAIVAATELALAIVSSGDEPRYAWLSSAGELDHYRDAEATLTTRETPGPAAIAVVVRDRAGGVAWRVVPIRILTDNTDIRRDIPS